MLSGSLKNLVKPEPRASFPFWPGRAESALAAFCQWMLAIPCEDSQVAKGRHDKIIARHHQTGTSNCVGNARPWGKCYLPTDCCQEQIGAELCENPLIYPVFSHPAQSAEKEKFPKFA